MKLMLQHVFKQRLMVTGSGLFVFLALLGTLAFCKETAVGSQEGCPVHFAMLKEKSGQRIPMFKEEVDPWDYRLLIESENGVWQLRKGPWLIIPFSATGDVKGSANLKPGTYRAVSNGNYARPFICDVKFKVRDVSKGQEQSVVLLHSERKMSKGHVQFVSKATRKPIEALVVRLKDASKKIGVEKVEKEQSFLMSVAQARTQQEGRLHFWFWQEMEQVIFVIDDYRFAEYGSPKTLKFSGKQLSGGVVWEIEERPVLARIAVALRTDEGSVPLTEEVLKSVLPKDRGSKFWSIPTFEVGSQVSADMDFRLAADQGRFDIGRGEFEYRDLQRGKRYAVAPYLKVFRDRLPLVQGGREVFFVEDAGPSVVNVIVASQPVSTEKRMRLKGRVLDEHQNAVEGGLIVLTNTSGIHHQALSDAGGRFALSLKACDYRVRITKRGFEPLAASVTLQNEEDAIYILRALPRLEISVKDHKGNRVRRGQVRVYSSGKMTAIAGRDVQDGKAIIDAVPRGKCLIVVHTMDNVSFLAKEVLVQERVSVVNLVLERGFETRVVVETDDMQGELPEHTLIVLWASWEGTVFMAATGRLDARSRGVLRISRKGRYTMELVKPQEEKGEDNLYKGSTAFYVYKLDIEPKLGMSEIRVRPKKETIHQFRGAPPGNATAVP